MKHTARKLLALVMVLAMLLSVFAVAEDDTQDIVGADGPIELGGEAVGDTQDPADGLEIAPDGGDGLLEGIEAPTDDLDLGLDGNLAIDLDVELDGAALESLEGELAPETEVAMNAGEGGTSESDAIEIGTWGDLVAAMDDGTKRSDEGAN